MYACQITRRAGAKGVQTADLGVDLFPNRSNELHGKSHTGYQSSTEVLSTKKSVGSRIRRRRRFFLHTSHVVHLQALTGGQL